MLGTRSARTRPDRDAAPPDGPPDRAAARRARRRSLLTDAAVLFGLAGLAVTQPLFDMFGDNPTFFVAGRYGTHQVVAFALVVAVLPGLVAALASVPFRLLGERVGAAAHGLAVGVVAGAFGLAVCRTVGIDHVAAAGVAALGLAVLLRPDGTINDARYPNFARLAERSTWFRDAASESNLTHASIPTLLTGVRANEDQVPTSDEHPRNYFTLYGDRYPASHYSPLTDMCPHDVCPGPAGGSFGRMLADASVVYRHRVLPVALREGLPPIDNSWGRFGDAIGIQAASTAGGDVNLLAQLDEVGVSGLTPAAQLDVLAGEVGAIGPEPSVDYVHVMVPHTPYLLTPWGGIDADTWEAGQVPADPDDAEASIYRDVIALQAMQIGAVDAALGEVIDHLEQVGAWDDALLVVASDHGIDATPPTFGRALDGGNQDELLRIPLFIKAPGQTAGEVRDEPASTVDVLPSIMDLLGIETDWDIEGHSLFDGSEPSVERLVTSTFPAALEVAARHARLFPEGDDWTALAAVGSAAGLVGDAVADHEVGDPSPLRWSPDRRELFDELATDGAVPYLLRGTVEGAGSTPVELVVALNGRIAGAVDSYRAEGEGWRVSGVMAPHFRDGRNVVAAYQVERSGDQIILHPVAER